MTVLAKKQERWQQPGPCQCQPDDDVWHAHYPDGKHSCARGCGCKEWRPSIKPVVDAIRAVRAAQQALEEAGTNLKKAWERLGKAANAPVGNDADNGYAMSLAEEQVTNHMIAEREKGYFR